MVDKAEQLLLDLGFHQLRVRIHGTLARIEVLPDELPKVLENREQIVKAFKEYGFICAALLFFIPKYLFMSQIGE